MLVANNVQKTFILIAAALLAAGVILGALGAHALESQLTADQLESYKTAVRYQMWMALGLLLIQVLSILLNMKSAVSSLLLVLGMLFFSGSIYGLVLLDAEHGLRGVLGPITPIGGLLMIISWMVLFVQVCRTPVGAKKQVN
jgi:uncharacterized membrane protein YgdD (TMEM256/DUF423 family)